MPITSMPDARYGTRSDKHKNPAMTKEMKTVIESNDPGCGRKYDPNLCRMRHRAVKIKEQRGQEHGPCAYCLIILNPQTEKEKPMEVKNKCKNIGCVREKTTKSGFCNGCYQKDWKERKAAGIPAPKITIIKTHKIADAKPSENVAAEAKPWPRHEHTETKPVKKSASVSLDGALVGLGLMAPPDSCRMAVAHFGYRNQMLKAAEECCELAAAINKYLSNDTKGPLPVLSEIADVEIMCEQLRLIFGSVEIEQMKLSKLIRLFDRIEEAKT